MTRSLLRNATLSVLAFAFTHGLAMPALAQVSAPALGTPSDAEAPTGNGTVIALSKAQRTILTNLLTAYGAPTDAVASTTGANGSMIALTKALRDRLNGIALDATLTTRLGTLGQKTMAGSAPVTIASDQSPVSVAQTDTVGSGTLDLTTANSAVEVIVPPGASTMGYSLLGLSGSGATISITAANDSGGLLYTDTASYARNGVGQRNNAITTNQASFVPVAGAKKVRFLVSVTGTGTSPVGWQFTTAASPVNVMNASAGLGGLNAPTRLASSAATTNATLVKTTPGRLYKIVGYNTTTSVRWLHLYDTATAPTPGSTAVAFALPLPPGAYSFDAMDIGYNFNAGIAYSITTGAADTDATAVAAGDIVQHNLWMR